MKINILILLILSHICANAQCRKTITIDDREYCIVSVHDSSLFDKFTSYHFANPHFSPKNGVLKEGYYVAYDQTEKIIALCFYINEKNYPEGLYLKFGRNRNQGNRIGCEFENALGNGEYAPLGAPNMGFLPMSLFEFSVEEFEKINAEIAKKYNDGK